MNTTAELCRVYGWKDTALHRPREIPRESREAARGHVTTRLVVNVVCFDELVGWNIMLRMLCCNRAYGVFFCNVCVITLFAYDSGCLKYIIDDVDMIV